MSPTYIVKESPTLSSYACVGAYIFRLNSLWVIRSLSQAVAAWSFSSLSHMYCRAISFQALFPEQAFGTAKPFDVNSRRRNAHSNTNAFSQANQMCSQQENEFSLYTSGSCSAALYIYIVFPQRVSLVKSTFLIYMELTESILCRDPHM